MRVEQFALERQAHKGTRVADVGLDVGQPVDVPAGSYCFRSIAKALTSNRSQYVLAMVADQRVRRDFVVYSGCVAVFEVTLL